MKRRVLLALMLACAALSGSATARAQSSSGGAAQGVGVAQEVPADRVTLEEFKRLRAEGKVFVLDVRYQIYTKIKGASHIPLDQLEARLSELPRDREIVTYCS
jgi:hypothetical protein